MWRNRACVFSIGCNSNFLGMTGRTLKFQGRFSRWGRLAFSVQLNGPPQMLWQPDHFENIVHPAIYLPLKICRVVCSGLATNQWQQRVFQR